ncbi:MAG: glycoside hydrolase family 73 protein [Saprospiraceae bacterium]
MRKNETKNTITILNKGVQDQSFFESKKHVGQNRTSEENVLPSFEMLFEKLVFGLKKPLVALKYHFYKLSFGVFDRVKLPWMKIGLVLLAAVVLLKKDVHFNFAFKSPLSAVGHHDDQPQGNEELSVAQTIAYQSERELNPYAPVSSDDLKTRETKAFIRKYADFAKHEMNAFGVPASIKMAQALIESRAGDSRLAKNNNNHFGIKCFSKNCKKGHCTNATDDHHKDFFRKYKKPENSWRSHSKLLSQGRYKVLHRHGKDYKAWAKGLKKVGYATDKNYDKKLISVIKKYQLYRLDQ